jgi:hypothetical protein
MLLFRSEEHVRRWYQKQGMTTGVTLTLEQQWELARVWYADRMSPEWRRRTPKEADSFRRSGLDWRLLALTRTDRLNTRIAGTAAPPGCRSPSGGRGTRTHKSLRTTVFKSVNELFQEPRQPTNQPHSCWSEGRPGPPWISGYPRLFPSL